VFVFVCFVEYVFMFVWLNLFYFIYLFISFFLFKNKTKTDICHKELGIAYTQKDEQKPLNNYYCGVNYDSFDVQREIDR